jgi:hypothetical protein
MDTEEVKRADALIAQAAEPIDLSAFSREDALLVARRLFGEDQAPYAVMAAFDDEVSDIQADPNS